MPATKFAPLAQGDDYRMENLSQERLTSMDTMDIQSAQHQAPTRWYSKKGLQSAYTPKVTYVSARVDEEDNFPEKKRHRHSSRLSVLANPVSNFRIPTFAAPWQHEHPQGIQPTSSKTVRYFDKSKQRRRVFVNGFLQWLLTLFIVLCQWACIFGFSRPKILHRGHKYTFNAITTLLSLSLGLAIVSALRSYAKLMSWRFLASKYRDLQDFELVMNCSSQTKVLKLLWAGRSPGRFWLNKTQILCLLSLFLVIGMQITIGMLGLTYSIDTADVYDHVYGNITIADLSNIYQDPAYYADGFVDQTGAANYFGSIGNSYMEYYNIPLGEGTHGLEAVYTADNETFFYNYVDVKYDPNAVSADIESTKRWISAKASCVELEIIQGGSVSPNDSFNALFYKDELGRNQSIWVSGQTTWTSTYMGNTSASDCGSRCTNILILDSIGFTGDSAADEDGHQEYQPHLFSCNSTVGTVVNSNLCEHPANCTLSDDRAKILAGSVGWSGTWNLDGNPLQYQTYPPGSSLSWDGYTSYRNAGSRAYQVTKFTIGAVAAMDDSGPRIVQPGMAPIPGVTLHVEWKYTIPVLCVVPAVQFFLLIIVCIWANGALIKDGSYLATARMLRPVVEKLEQHGCALTGDEIARQLGNFKIIYGVRAPPGTESSTAYTPDSASHVDWHVGIIAESEGFGQAAEEGWRPAATFPEGRYDGVGYSTAEVTSRKRKRIKLVVEEEESSEDDSDSINDEKAYLLGGDKFV